MKKISLAHGAGGAEMDALIKSLGINFRGAWENCDDDSAVLNIGSKSIVFTTDSFVVDPIFFPGGNIGDLAMCGTINDLCMMGAIPMGLSLAAVIEEGFSISALKQIFDTAKKISEKTGVPIVTGDTKVMERNKIDKLILVSAGVGLADNVLNKEIREGDRVIISGGLGEHAAALLSKRFDYETDIVSDTKPLIEEIMAVRDKIKVAKDITRGGLSSVLNEIASRSKVAINLDEEKIPSKRPVKSICEMLGINLYELASEGKFVCISSKENSREVLRKLKIFNKDAAIIGKVKTGEFVTVQTSIGKRIMPKPRGRIVPRIC